MSEGRDGKFMEIKWGKIGTEEGLIDLFGKGRRMAEKSRSGKIE
jgi:hypothetical protein